MKRIIRKISSVLLSVVVITSMVGCGKTSVKSSNSDSGSTQESKELQKLKEKGTIVVGSSGDAPFAYIDQQTGEFKGVDAEIIKEAAKRLGINNVEMKLIPFSELILNLNSDNIDIICDCMYIKSDRAKQVQFGDVWYTQGGGLAVPENSNINSEEDFDPKTTTVGYTTGTIWQGVVEGWEKDGKIKKAVATGNQSESLIALQYGKIDAFLTDSTVLENLFNNSPDTVKGLKICKNYKDTDATIGHIAPAVKKENKEFIKELNDEVVKLRDEGFIEKVFEKYKLDPKLHMITNDEKEYTPND